LTRANKAFNIALEAEGWLSREEFFSYLAAAELEASFFISTENSPSLLTNTQRGYILKIPHRGMQGGLIWKEKNAAIAGLRSGARKSTKAL
jgi:hypothetical protein